MRAEIFTRGQISCPRRNTRTQKDAPMGAPFLLPDASSQSSSMQMSSYLSLPIFRSCMAVS